ncbi:tubulin-tyrosine ligase family protein, putative [Ichthyophthirius multifiliis]|uniref:Tubulin-tyrosine ligase family protein, putative n=1 Tax=Ichthyophthirius multifiliis TaxID=5932 RepID=G0R0B5_ICHMU|nr:tubulin-tyrosine ligase family protein, putative [Ichthyophthirius multifiliis]EGR29093.1 tubulin-tyrosine ligase family protein, putative [Ichthyophthirius multifiliis]|eukprot:XP_004030329.1 tubulin-tyrosine ligase family protein, putative [Ichthyophthirius multifiliis]
MNVSDTKYEVIKFVAKKIMQWKLNYDSESSDWDVFWTDNAVQPDQLQKMKPYQKISHFPGMYSLARKNYLAKNLLKMRKFFQQYNFFPDTWLLPTEYNEFRKFIEQKGKNMSFIVKPEALCQGKGIFLIKNIEEINPQDHYVVQRYLNKPFLINNLKFDFRFYVLLAGCEPLRIYIFYEGLARFATEEYKQPSKDNMDNMCMHLTNYAINKDNPKFQFNSDMADMNFGHKKSSTSVLDYLEQQGHDVNLLWKNIKRIIIKTIISSQPTLSHNYRCCQPNNFMNNMCFEILGFDIMVDENLKPWLLEVNHTPSFTTDTPLDSFIKKNVIRDALKLMNINIYTKNQIINERNECMQKRVLTGKKLKYSNEEKLEEIKKAQKLRDEYEDANLGGYEKIYPIDVNNKQYIYIYIHIYYYFIINIYLYIYIYIYIYINIYIIYQDDEGDQFKNYLQITLQIYDQATGASNYFFKQIYQYLYIDIKRNSKKTIEEPKKIIQNKKVNNALNKNFIKNNKQQFKNKNYINLTVQEVNQQKNIKKHKKIGIQIIRRRQSVFRILITLKCENK